MLATVVCWAMWEGESIPCLSELSFGLMARAVIVLLPSVIRDVGVAG